MEITIGSIWREHDARFNRYVKVVELVGGTINRVVIQTVTVNGEPVSGRTTSAAQSAFGRRYRFLRAA